MQTYSNIVACVFIYFTLETPVSRSSCFFYFWFWSNFFVSLASLWVSVILSLTDSTCPNTNAYSCGCGVGWVRIKLYWLNDYWRECGMMFLAWLTMIYARFVTPSLTAFLTWCNLFQRSFLTLLISLHRYILFVSISAIFFWYASCSSLSPSTFYKRFASSGPLMMT